MSEAPPITVVIPAYNRARTIGVAIASVLGQSRGDFEIVVVDDASTDGTAEIVSAIADPRLRLIRHETNRGAGGARNTGSDAAQGKWIAFQDSDDEWLPRKLEKQMARLEAAGADFVGAYCGLLTLGELDDRSAERLAQRYTPHPSIHPVEGDILEPLLGSNLISTQTLVVRRDLLVRLGGFDPDIDSLEDWEFAIRLAQQGPIAFVDEPLVYQRFSPNSLTRDRRRAHAARIRLVEKHAAVFARHPARLARQYETIACEARDRGDLAVARCWAARARTIQPGNPRLWARTAEMAGRSLGSLVWRG